MNRNQRRQRGFSLLELVIVLIILGTIMGFLAPRIFGNVEKANQSSARVKIEQLSGQLEVMRYVLRREAGARFLRPVSLGCFAAPGLHCSLKLRYRTLVGLIFFLFLTVRSEGMTTHVFLS